MQVFPVHKGSTLRIGYAVTEGDPASINVAEVGMRLRTGAGQFSGPFIAAAVERRPAQGAVPAGFNFVFADTVTADLPIGDYQLDSRFQFGNGESEGTPPIMVRVTPTALDD